MTNLVVCALCRGHGSVIRKCASVPKALQPNEPVGCPTCEGSGILKRTVTLEPFKTELRESYFDV